MKNIININSDGELLISAINDGTNTLYINDTLVPSSNWIGSGNYTDTIEGHNITITKAPALTGNIQLVRNAEYSYSMKIIKPVSLLIIDTIYPVGSYYYTSDTSFDPNIAWGGEWTSAIDNNIITWHRIN
jgi:hypothetical protein